MKAILMNMLMTMMVILMAEGHTMDIKDSSKEQRWNIQYGDEYTLKEKMSNLEMIVNNQQGLINELQEQIRVSLLPHWGDWSTWSDCFMNCTGKSSGRVQTRSRETLHSSTKEPEKETEERPCNAVQFAGCIKSSGPDDNYGVTYDFADQIAVSTCTALLPGSSNHVYAIRRTCSKHTVSCDDVCKHVATTCFNALHVYRQSTVLKRNQDGEKGLYLYRYNSCSGSYCGPNFCCCHA